MNDKLTSQLSELNNEHLSQEERVLLRMKITSFMTANLAAIPTPYARKYSARSPILAGGVLALFMLSWGVSFAAETALPGDVLYPIKIHVNEGVSRALARTPAHQAVVAQKEVERRALETEQLTKEKRLDSKLKTSLANKTEHSLQSFVVAQDALMRAGASTTAEQAVRSLRDTFDRHNDAFEHIGIAHVERDNDEKEYSVALVSSRTKEEVAGIPRAVSTTSRREELAKEKDKEMLSKHRTGVVFMRPTSSPSNPPAFVASSSVPAEDNERDLAQFNNASSSTTTNTVLLRQKNRSDVEKERKEKRDENNLQSNEGEDEYEDD